MSPRRGVTLLTGTGAESDESRLPRDVRLGAGSLDNDMR